MNKIVKFGGSSLADATQFKKVANIIKSDKSRRFVVPSAPGKRFKDEKTGGTCRGEKHLCEGYPLLSDVTVSVFQAVVGAKSLCE